jgi:hypothetical protein
MITADNYGLPSAKELEDWAQSCFPEFKESSGAYSPVVVPMLPKAPVSPNVLGANLSNSNFDVSRIRADFPILNERLSNGKQLI